MKDSISLTKYTYYVTRNLVSSNSYIESTDWWSLRGRSKMGEGTNFQLLEK